LLLFSILYIPRRAAEIGADIALLVSQGISMMDFFVREVRTVVVGPMAIIRFGTCGGLSLEHAREGNIVVAGKGSMLVTRNFSHFASPSSGDASDKGQGPYVFHHKALANDEMSANLVRELTGVCGADRVKSGLNVTADSFYSSQSK
jgi:uridine phosphorylase